MPAQLEPIPGWVDNLNGFIGMTVGALKGVWVAMWINGECHPELVSVDVAANNLIAMAWKMGKDTQR